MNRMASISMMIRIITMKIYKNYTTMGVILFMRSSISAMRILTPHKDGRDGLVNFLCGVYGHSSI